MQRLTERDIVCKPRLLSAAGGSGVSNKVSIVLKEFLQEEKGIKSKSNVLIHDPESLRTYQFTRNDWGVSSSCPTVFESDSRCPIAEVLLFIRDGQVFCQPLDGGDAVQVTSFDVPVNEFKVFQQSTLQVFLILSMSVYPSKSPTETQQQDAVHHDSSAMVFDQLLVRHWVQPSLLSTLSFRQSSTPSSCLQDTWQPNSKRNHLFLCPLETTGDYLLACRPERAIDLMFGVESDCPTKPFGGVEDYTVSPDGSSIAFVCRTASGENVSRCAWTTESLVQGSSNT